MTQWLVASPGTGIHARQAALALAESNLLDYFMVPVARDASSWIQRIARSAFSIVGRPDPFARRAVLEVDAGRVSTHSMPEFVRAAVQRVDRGGSVTDAVWDWSARRFTRAAARRLAARPTDVYAYEYTALELFEKAVSLGRRRVLEVSSCDSLEVMELQRRAIELNPLLGTPYIKRLHRLAPARARIREREWEMADIVIVNSDVARDSMQRAGRDVRKVRVVPLGFPDAQFSERGINDGPLRLLWAGTFGLRKGADVLLAALDRLEVPVAIDVFGLNEMPHEAAHRHSSRINIRGTLPQSELFSAFSRYDLLLLPTRSDAFGMVITEAMSHGLPVLTTPDAGASLFVEDGRNGIVVPSGDAEALASALIRAAGDRPLLSSMRSRARAAASAWSWSDYRRALRNAIGIVA